MRIERLGHRVHVQLKHVVAAGLQPLPQPVVVALDQQLAGGGLILARQHQGQHLVLQPLAPDLIEFRGGLGPGRVLAVHVQGFVHVEPELLLKQGLDPARPLRQPTQVSVEDVVGRLQVAALQGVVQGRAILFETGDIAGQEIGPTEIEIVEIRGQDQRGQPVVQLALPVMMLRQQPGDGLIQ